MDQPAITFHQGSEQVLIIKQPEFFTISCGTGSVRISLKDGTATIKDCVMNEAAISFWAAVKQMAPVCEQPK